MAPTKHFSMRLDDELRSALEVLAAIDRRSLAWEAQEAVRLYVEGRRAEIEARRKQEAIDQR